jgi:PAS domain S-box-containing protein
LLTQRLIEAIGRLQAQPTHTILGSIYIYDLVDQRTICASCSVATILGYSADTIAALGPIGLSSLIHPDDLNLVSEHYQRFATLRYGDVISVTYRMKRADGTWCWLHSQETSLVQAIDGFPLQILGIIDDITQRSTSRVRRLAASGRFLSRRRLSSVISAFKQHKELC